MVVESVPVLEEADGFVKDILGRVVAVFVSVGETV